MSQALFASTSFASASGSVMDFDLYPSDTEYTRWCAGPVTDTPNLLRLDEAFSYVVGCCAEVEYGSDVACPRYGSLGRTQATRRRTRCSSGSSNSSLTRSNRVKRRQFSSSSTPSSGSEDSPTTERVQIPSELTSFFRFVGAAR